mgnify:FL=1
MRHKRYKRREGRLTSKDIKECEFFAIEGRNIKSQKVEFKFWRGYNVVASIVLYDDAPHKQTVIRWHDHRYYTLQYGAKVAKPYNMTLAKWKSIEGKMLCANRRM